jgi:type II secretory pathway component PulF
MNAPAGGNSIAPTLADFIAINEEIGALVRARLPLESHLARIGGELPGKSGELAARVGRRMEAGESLASAIDAECASLPAAYRAAIVAGIESGELGGALESLVDTASRLDELRRVTGLAVLYPLMVVSIACLLFGLVLSAVIPQFDWLNESHFGPLSELARTPWAVTTIAFVVPSVLVLAAAIWWWRSGSIGGALAWLPGVRRVNQWGQAATLAELLRLLVERGLPLDQALTLAGDAVDDRKLRSAAHQLAARVRSGEAAGGPTSGSGSTDRSGFPLLVRLALRHASDRRLMTAGLDEAAMVYRERAIRAADWYAQYVPILFTVVIGGTITIAFALLIFWPYTSMLREVAQWNWN